MSDSREFLSPVDSVILSNDLQVTLVIMLDYVGS